MTTFDRFFKDLDQMQYELKDEIYKRVFDAVDAMKNSDVITQKWGKLFDEAAFGIVKASINLARAVIVHETDQETLNAILYGDVALATPTNKDVKAIAAAVVIPIISAWIDDMAECDE